MTAYKMIKISEEKEKISESIFHCCLGREHIFNVISVPYNSSVILLKTILFFVSNKKNVLYITNENEVYIELIDYIRKYSGFRNYIYMRKKGMEANSLLVVSNHENALEINSKFDLIIYDDIRNFPCFSTDEIRSLMMDKTAVDGKLITYSVENILKNGREFILPVKDNKMPLTEPRVITTRLDIHKDIPYVVYEYLEWSIKSNRKTIIYVPNSEKVDLLFKYMCNFKEVLSKDILYYKKGKSDIKIAFNFAKMKKGIIVTDDFEDVGLDLKALDVMVFFADDPSFNYKKLIYFCGKVGRSEKYNKGEVIFLANEETKDIEKAKYIARNFNKEAWEMGLLNI